MILPLLTFDIQYYVLFIKCLNLWNIFFCSIKYYSCLTFNRVPTYNLNVYISPDGREI